MMKLMKKLASLRLSLAGMIALALVAVAAAGEDGIDTAFAAFPIAVLVLNLVAALLVNRSFRTQTGLLVFHVGLLLVFLLAGLTVLSRFDGHIEVMQGESFEAQSVVVEERGWLHAGRLDRVQFTQREISVDYLPGLRRQSTTSTIEVPDDDGRVISLTIGDRHTVRLQGYRIAATFNKGFAVVLGWHGDDGNTAYGSIHFPSYPENDWNQRIDWITPGGELLQLELRLAEPPFKADAAWALGRTDVPFTLHIDSEGTALAAGDEARVAGGRISVEGLSMWMGYRVDYLPLLPWMLAAAFMAVAGLALHFKSHYLRRAVSSRQPADATGDSVDVAAA